MDGPVFLKLPIEGVFVFTLSSSADSATPAVAPELEPSVAVGCSVIVKD